MGEFSNKTVRLVKDILSGWRDADLENFFSGFGLSQVYRMRKFGWGRLARINDVFAALEYDQAKRDAIIREVVVELWRDFQKVDDPDNAFKGAYGKLVNSLNQDGFDITGGKLASSFPERRPASIIKEVPDEMERKKLEKFPEGVLEHISKTIGDYRTGSEIAELLRVAGYPEKSQVVGTKWRFLYATFKEFNDQPEGQYHVAKIVQTFCDPTQWIGRESMRKQILNSLNEALIHANLQLNEQGKLIWAERRTIYKKVEEEQLEKPEATSMTVTPIFRARDMETERNLCFVLMPFKPPFDRLYREEIKPAIETSGFKCLRADDLFSPTPILEDIWVYICKSRVIIADVTGKNPNVFYEIGVAHTVGKPVIIITQDKSDVPFDIAQFRYFVYSDDAQGWETLCRNIASALKSL